MLLNDYPMLIDIDKLYDHKTKATINVSKKGLKCHEISKLLLKYNVLSDVITKHSVVKNKKTNAYEMENGCLINIYGVKSEHIKNLVWVPLKYEFCFNCCHINITKEIDNDKINIYNNVYDNEKVKTIFIGCVNRWNN